MRGKTGDGAVALPQVLDSHDSANEEIFKQCSYARFLARKKIGNGSVYQTPHGQGYSFQQFLVPRLDIKNPIYNK